MVRRAGCLAVATWLVACGGEIREIRPVAIETPVACVVPRASERQGEPATSPTTDEPPIAADTSARVVVRADAEAGCEAEAIDVIEAPLGESEAGAVAELRVRAARLGAEVVLEARRAVDAGRPRLVGTAARCRDVRRARPYDVVEQIDIAGVSGGAEAAFAKLRARAWDLHADLVLDVHLKEDLAELTHVTGTAIRYR